MSTKYLTGWSYSSAQDRRCDSLEESLEGLFRAQPIQDIGPEHFWCHGRSGKSSKAALATRISVRDIDAYCALFESAIQGAVCVWSRLGQVEPEPDRLDELLNQAESILSLPDDWDGEGASPVSRAAWDRAVALLNKSIRVPSRRGLVLPLPAIDPCPDGSVDLEWYKDEQCLLINVPSSMSDPVTYYGRRMDCGDGRGILCEDADNAPLIAWILGVRL